VSPGVAGRRPGSKAGLLLAGLIVIAAALRFWELGNWGFDSDETFTLRDSQDLDPSNPRPLLYILNHYLLGPWLPLDEFGLRLLPAVFGVLAIPALYFVARRLVGTRAALFATLLLTFSGLHVYYSQFARYWSLVFLLATVYPFAIYLGLREHNRRMLVLGVVTGVAAVLAHPASVLLLGGLVPWILVTYFGPDQRSRLRSHKRAIWLGLFVVILAVVIATQFVPMLQDWVTQSDTKRTPSEFLLHIPGKQGLKQIVYMFVFMESLTIPATLAGALGIVLLWQGRDRSFAVLLASMVVVPPAFLVLVSLRAPVGVFYLVPTIPIVFIGAGVFLDRLTAVDVGLRPPWLLPASVTLMIIAAGAPTLISQYRDGRRYDFRGAAHWLHKRLGPADVVYSDQFKVMLHYLPGVRIERLRANPEPLAATVRAQHASGQGALWIISPAPAHAFRTNPHLGSLTQWMYAHCQIRNTFGVGRVDFRQYYLQIYRCPAAMPAGAVANSE
jgi:4-amino-4-deoxy-L-arabinose transferase-like glycosyltransferase